MTTLKFAVHQIEDNNGVHLNEVFEPLAADLEVFERVGAVREPTEEELAFYKLTKGEPAKAVASKPAAPAAAKKAAESADDEIK